MAETPPLWLPLSDLLAYLKVASGSDNEPAVDASRKAAGAVVQRYRRDLDLGSLDPVANQADADRLDDELADVVMGATLLAARLYARKGSPAGVATFGEIGASYILRNDPDVAQLCGIGRFGKPVVG